MHIVLFMKAHDIVQQNISYSGTKDTRRYMLIVYTHVCSSHTTRFILSIGKLHTHAYPHACMFAFDADLEKASAAVRLLRYSQSHKVAYSLHDFALYMYVRIYIHTYIRRHSPSHEVAYSLHDFAWYMHVCICIHTYISVYIHTYTKIAYVKMLASKHAYIHAYINT